MQDYHEFTLDLTRLSEDGPIVVTATSAGRDPRQVTGRRDSEDERKNLDYLLELYAKGKLRDRPRYNLGKRLAQMLFPEDIRAQFVNFMDVLPTLAGCRLRLRVHSPALFSLPWENAVLGPHEPPLALNDRISIVRHPVDPERSLPELRIATDMPVRMLYVRAARVQGAAMLGEGEDARLREVIDGSGRQVVLHRVMEAELKDNMLDDAIALGAQIFHFSGHGEDDGEPAIVIPSSDGLRGQLIYADELASTLPGAGVQIVVLATCGSGRSSDEAWAGFATKLIDAGIPAVVAMQETIEDAHGQTFVAGFYRELLASGSLDAAMSAGRHAILHLAHLQQWGTPVLYSRASSLSIPGWAPPLSDAPRVARRRKSRVHHSVVDHVSGAWVCISDHDSEDASDSLRIAEAEGTRVGVRALGGGSRWRAAWTLEEPVDALALTPDGTALVASFGKSFGIAELHRDGRVNPWPMHFDRGDSQLLAAQREGPNVRVLLDDGSRIHVARASHTGMSDRLHDGRPSPNGAAAIGDRFAVVDRSGQLSRAVVAFLRPGEADDDPVEWISIDVASGLRATVVAAIASCADGQTLYVHRDDRGSAEIRRVSLDGDCGRVVVPRTLDGSVPSSTLVLAGDSVIDCRWQDLEALASVS